MTRPPISMDARRARLVAADLLSRRPWTRAELTRRLCRRGATLEVAADVAADLVARGHLDDAAFARHWVETRAERGYGAARLRAELRQRGVAPELIEVALGALGRSGALAGARAVAERRLPGLRGLAPERAAARLRDHLLRRGYASGIVLRVVREALGARSDPTTLIE